MEARQDHPENEDGEETALLLRRPPGHDLPLAQQSTHFDESHAGTRRQYEYIAAQGSSRIHAGDSYVEQQHNYYGPEATPEEPARKTMSLQTALAFPEMSLRAVNIATAQAQTCDWIFETPEYKRWLDPASRPSHHGILWIKGKPGAGKSTIMKHILRTSQTKRNTGRFISFFFNARGQGLARSTEGLYRALLHPIVDTVSLLEDMVDPELRPILKDQGWPIELLKDLFREAVRHYRYEGSLTCCVDALDECDEDEIRDMLALFEDLCEMASSEKLPFSVCFTSRHYPNITIAHTEEIVIDDLRGHQKDISNYVQRRLRLPHVKEALKEELVTDIRQRASGVFLWVILVVGILNKTGDRGNIHSLRNRLREIPTNLRELFDDIIKRDQSDVNFLPMMQWMLYSIQQLTATELYFAVMISTNSLTMTTIRWDKDVVHEQMLRSFITTSSKGFLEYVYTPAQNLRRFHGQPSTRWFKEHHGVQFIHESAREFFRECGLHRLDPLLGNAVAEATDTIHQRLARWCLSYLELSLAQYWSITTKTNAPSSKSVLNSSSLDSMPFLVHALAYGACYQSRNVEHKWFPCDHVTEDSPGLECITRRLEDRLASVDDWWPLLKMRHTPGVHKWMEKAHAYLLQKTPETPIVANRHILDKSVQRQVDGDAWYVARCRVLCIMWADRDTFTALCEPRPADPTPTRQCRCVADLKLLIDHRPEASI